jgi:hypothetical protein
MTHASLRVGLFKVSLFPDVIKNVLRDIYQFQHLGKTHCVEVVVILADGLHEHVEEHCTIFSTASACCLLCPVLELISG